MTGRVRLLPMVCFITLAASARLSASVGAEPPTTRYATTHIIVQLDRSAQDHVRQWARSRGSKSTRIDPMRALGPAFQAETRRWNATRMRPLYFEEFANPAAAAKYGLDRLYVLDVPAGTDTPAMVQSFRQLGAEVELATLDAEITVAGDFSPNDPYFHIQWGLRNVGQFVGQCSNVGITSACQTNAECPGGLCIAPSPGGVINGTPDVDIDASDAWLIETGLAADVTIAIIDSGVSPHSEFGSRLLPGRNTDDPFQNPTLTLDQCPHGTHVAGIAAAGGHNGIGIAGVTWGAKILPVRVLGHDRFGQTNPCSGVASALTNGIIWAADNGADIANFSLQYYLSQLTQSDINQLQAAIDYAGQQGMLLIAATGNHTTGSANPGVAYPGRLRDVIAVGATDAMDRRASGVNNGWNSNYGAQIDVAAPGDDIFSTGPTGGYYYLRGTSMATPHVTGVAALLKANQPQLSERDIADIITIAVEDLGPIGWDEDFGYGRINAAMALDIAAAWPLIDSTPSNRAIDARQPTDPLGFENYGWDSIEIVSTPDVVAGLVPESISVQQRCPASLACGPAPEVLGIDPMDAERATIVLDSPVNLQVWTRIQPNARSLIRLAYLPGDVNANQTTDSADAASLLAELPPQEDPEFQTSLPEWSVDLDRSGAFTSLDLLTCVDLLNGADAHAVWLGKRLEPGIE